MQIAEVRMLRLMYGHTRSDKIRNEDIRVKVGVAFIVDKMRESKHEIVWKCKEEMHRCPIEEVQEVGYSGYEERLEYVEKNINKRWLYMTWHNFSLPKTWT